MRLNKFLNAVAGAALFASIVGCSDISFNSVGGPGVSPAPSQQMPGLAKPLPTGPLDYGDGGIRGPQACDAASLKAVPAGVSCPDNYAVYGIDDPGSRNRFGTLACCPLPALNIFKGTATPRPGSCSENEILVGNDNADKVICRAINTDVYKLVDAQVCYFGSGSSGKGNAPTCAPLQKDGIPAAFAAIVGNGKMMGSDGCLNFPYGSLSVAQTGGDCSDQKAKQLLRVDDKPLVMFK